MNDDDRSRRGLRPSRDEAKTARADARMRGMVREWADLGVKPADVALCLGVSPKFVRETLGLPPPPRRRRKGGGPTEVRPAPRPTGGVEAARAAEAEEEEEGVGQLKHVAALAAQMNREIDLRRAVGVGRIVGDEGPLRILMGLYAGPLNRRQAGSISGAGSCIVRTTLGLMLKLGVAEDVGRSTKLHCYQITPKGRRLLEAVIETAGETEDAKLSRDLEEPSGVRLIGERRTAVRADAS